MSVTFTPLPDPDVRPGKAVVIYDGECRFCYQQASRVARWDGRHQFGFLPAQDPRVAQRYSDLSYEQLMTQMYVITPSGSRLGGIDAVRYITRQNYLLWPLAAFLHIPFTRPLWARLYRLVAKYRYLIGGKRECDGACKIHF